MSQRRMIGADPRVLEDTARRLSAAADELAAVPGSLRPALVSSGWEGPDFEQFVNDWDTFQRHRVQSAVTMLNDAADRLRRNAAEQRSASGESAGASSGRGSIGGHEWLQGFLSGGYRDIQNALSLAATPAVGLLTRNSNVVGRYKSWYVTLARGPADWLRFKKSPILQGLHRVRGPLHLGARWLGAGIGGIEIANSGFDVWNQARTGDHWGAAASGADGVATGLKLIKVNPATYLVGAGVQAWTEVAREASRIDWSGEGRRQIKDGLASMSVAEQAEMWLDTAGRAPSLLAEVFL